MKFLINSGPDSKSADALSPDYFSRYGSETDILYRQIQVHIYYLKTCKPDHLNKRLLS